MSALIVPLAWGAGGAAGFALAGSVLCWRHYVHQPARRAYEQRQAAQREQTAATPAEPVSRPEPARDGSDLT